jgi:hypothetical protein
VTYETKFTTSPGETVTLDPIRLVASRRLTLAPDCSDMCVVVVDQKTIGPISKIGHQVDVPTPDSGPQEVLLRCPQNTAMPRHTYQPSDGFEVVFSCAPP